MLVECGRPPVARQHSRHRLVSCRCPCRSPLHPRQKRRPQSRLPGVIQPQRVRYMHQAVLHGGSSGSSGPSRLRAACPHCTVTTNAGRRGRRRRHELPPLGRRLFECLSDLFPHFRPAVVLVILWPIYISNVILSLLYTLAS